ncbi:general glycosylation pathway protein [Campylobacter sp. RM9344]|uniref:General glycosylation pathway protein n=1 Tax=Campylobacter californiensis TaxID=1032243 RepID=A0AAW3ZXI7_9BACT|nr:MULTISPECIES: STT3 domain-containing protein [unclassified Campylobacter]MBE2985240.1 general glycosylation pathway protein [Campylobacter sp. RM6883]MBE2986879.1 general glycosylation pathway protein [Campylobacter sp. RM12919]MBE2988562.1 general glycosylation pathway protein [Campylobacter sp. RM12920]MBE2995674.1 general glycosylation pathway protein [Campylobacter sp. RM6913]MBE3029739.1 general glycosylation pathway protein [Campylobacter sp. RM9344]
MNKILDFIKNFHLSKQLFLLIFLAFCLSVIARLYWVFWASSFVGFFHNNELMISTNDGYAFAEGTRDMLAGFHQPNDLSYFGSSLSTLTFWIVKLFDLNIESVMIYLSVILSSLVVIPIILIAREYNALKAGFIAALLGSVANSYYNRTMAGYYDTDMLIIVFGVFLIWGVIRVLESKDAKSLIIAPITILAYMWWYLSAFSLIAATTILLAFYTLVFDRKNALNYILIAFMLLAISNFDQYAKFALILAIYLVILFKKSLLTLKISIAILVGAFAFFAINGGLNPIIFQLKFYVFRNVSELSNLSFHYFNVNQTIQESGIVDLVLFCERISGHVLTFAVSLFGTLLLCIKKRSFIVALGMLLLGFLALKGGLRFTIYAVPVMAIGFGYVIVFVLEKLKFSGILFKTVYIFIAVLSLYPVATHIYNYKISPVFDAKEVRVLDELKRISGREDYVLTWWDYGYPIRYYSDVKTLIDGGKHLGRDNFAVSFALGENQTSSVNMARLEVEYTERNFNEKFGANLNQILKEYESQDVNLFLNSLNDKSFKLPKKTREIYYYLPERMLNIFPTILQFSRLDLKTGQKWNDPVFFTTKYFRQDSDKIALANGITITSDMRNIVAGNNKIQVNSFLETKYNENGKLEVTEYNFDTNAKIYIIFMRDYGRFLVIDESMFNSVFIQLFALERYDEELFEPVILDSATKIYRLKK